jgi:hsp70-interacting protein
MMHLASSEDAEVREAALRGLLELARDKTKEDDGRLGEEDEKLKQVLQERINGISLMSPEDLGAAKDERRLVDSLWNTCYNEPSSLREKGLLVLPGEDAPPPDVASKHFEPPLRAWAANTSADKSPSDKKKETPLLLGPGPPPETADSRNNSGAGEDSNGQLNR